MYAVQDQSKTAIGIVSSREHLWNDGYKGLPRLQHSLFIGLSHILVGKLNQTPFRKLSSCGERIKIYARTTQR